MGDVSGLSSQQIIDRLHSLPTLPAIVYELQRVIDDPMASLSDVEDIMIKDQSMTTQVLRLANSAYYAIPGGVNNLARAIGYIGFEAIHQLVLSLSVIDALKIKNGLQFNIGQFWKHSLGTAIAAEAIAEFIDYESPEDLFTCGLLHDMGKVALYIVAPDLFEDVLRTAMLGGRSFFEAETLLNSPTHVLIGQQLAVRWKLPAQIQNVILHHHQLDRKQRGLISAEMNLVIDMVYLANLLAHALKIGQSGHAQESNVPRDLLERIQLAPERIEDLVSEVRLAVEKADGFLRLIGGANGETRGGIR